jgi:hypothetical protein
LAAEPALPSDEAYLEAIAEAMGEEYRAIVDAGFLLQIDDPDLADAWQIHPHLSVPEYRQFAELRVEALNHALRDIPPERVRLHVCWGSYHGPHQYDIPLEDKVRGSARPSSAQGPSPQCIAQATGRVLGRGRVRGKKAKEDRVMTANTRVDMARSDVVGSLLQPAYLREARQGVHEGRVSEAELHAAEDRAVREAIALQEAAGLEVITDGEFRRYGWIATIPTREDRSYHAPLSGFAFLPADPGWMGLWREPDGRRPGGEVASHCPGGAARLAKVTPWRSARAVAVGEQHR